MDRTAILHLSHFSLATCPSTTMATPFSISDPTSPFAGLGSAQERHFPLFGPISSCLSPTPYHCLTLTSSHTLSPQPQVGPICLYHPSTSTPLVRTPERPLAPVARGGLSTHTKLSHVGLGSPALLPRPVLRLAPVSCDITHTASASALHFGLVSATALGFSSPRSPIFLVLFASSALYVLPSDESSATTLVTTPF